MQRPPSLDSPSGGDPLLFNEPERFTCVPLVHNDEFRTRRDGTLKDRAIDNELTRFPSQTPIYALAPRRMKQRHRKKRRLPR